MVTKSKGGKSAASVKDQSGKADKPQTPPSPLRLDELSDDQLMAVMEERRAKRQAEVDAARSAFIDAGAAIQAAIQSEDADAEIDRLIPSYQKAARTLAKVFKQQGGQLRFSFRASGGNGGGTPKGLLAESVVAALKGGNKTPKQLQEAATAAGALSNTNNPSSRIAQTLALLKERGIAETVERGVWRLIESAKAEAASAA
jgi:hypothetical protein